MLLVIGGLFGCDPPSSSETTVAGIEVVRPIVEVASKGGTRHALDRGERLSEGSSVHLLSRSRALLFHDAGARILLAGEADGDEGEKEANREERGTLFLTAKGATLERGRAFVEAGAGGSLEIGLGEVIVVAQGAGFEVQKNPTQVTVLRGEIAWRGKNTRGILRAGQRGSLDAAAGSLVDKPLALWDDWTGGLGFPDPRKSGGAAGLGEVGARVPGNLGEARFPLAVHRLQVRTVIEDDLAVTTVEQTFFNPATSTLEGLFRLRIPEGAILSRFAIDRHGRLVDGYVKERETARRQYQAQVYQGSTHDPALLEWEAPGLYKARLYPLPPGAKRRVLFTYSEWLPAHEKDSTLRTYRYPMAPPPGSQGVMVQELDIEVDFRKAEATSVRAGLGSILQKGERRVVLQRTDYTPSADLVVELLGASRKDTEARAYRVLHRVPERPGAMASRKPEDDYVLIRALPLAATDLGKRSPLDLLILVDVSAATDETHLAMARTLVDSLLRHLSPADRVALLSADLDIRNIGPAGPQGKGANEGKLKDVLRRATPEEREKLLLSLARVRTGGATDLGATLSQAATVLEEANKGESERQSAVLYVGDALPTVGELSLSDLKERLARLPQPLRLYGVGIGSEADLGLLTGLSSESAGLSFRVADRATAAETALRVMAHLSRKVASRLQVSVGNDVDRAYPRETQAISVLAGEPITVVARARRGIPKEITISGVIHGQSQPFVKKLQVITKTLSGGGADVRLRWAEARLAELIQSGVGVEAVAELGVRQNLITPFTSFYVPSEDEIGLLEQRFPKVRAAGCSRSMESAAPPPAAVEVSTPGAPPPVQHAKRAREQEGKMGKKDSGNRKGFYALRGPSGDEAGEADDAPVAEAQAAAAPAASAPRAEPAAPIEAPKEEAEKKTEAANFDKDGRADRLSQAGVLGLVGSGAGGGGTGEGTIGLGNLGTIGGGPQPAPKVADARRRANAPDAVSFAAPEVRGAMSPEIIRRIVLRHRNEVLFCHERESIRNPALQGRVSVQFTILSDGNVGSATVQSSTVNNPALEQCLAAAVRRWQFPKVVGTVIVTYPFVFRPRTQGSLQQAPRHGRRLHQGRKRAGAGAVIVSQQLPADTSVTVVVGIIPHRPKGCSAASSLPLSERSELWRERLSMRPGLARAQEIYQDAASGCEVPRWTDRRELLQLMVRSVVAHGGPGGLVGLYRHFQDSPEEQDYLRKAILGQVKSPKDLRIIYDGMGLGDEERETLSREILQKAKTPQERLTKVRELLAKWPKDIRLRLVQMETEELIGDKDAARRTAEDIARDPLADAQARTQVGELYLRLGDLASGRRIFSEIVEFAPRDPLARRRLGDLYRAHGWYQEASRQYQTLLTLSPGDPAVLLLQALAATGSGHVEQSLGLLERVSSTAEPGAEAGLPRAALLFAGVELALLREGVRKKIQQGTAGPDPQEELARLTLRQKRIGSLGLSRPLRIFLRWAHPEADFALRAAGPGEPLAQAGELWPHFGLLGFASQKDADPNGSYTVEVSQKAGGAQTYTAELVVVLREGQKGERLISMPLKLTPEQKVLRLALRDGKLEVQ